MFDEFENHSHPKFVDECYTHAFNITHIKRITKIEKDVEKQEYCMYLEERWHNKKDLWKGVENWNYIKDY